MTMSMCQPPVASVNAISRLSSPNRNSASPKLEMKAFVTLTPLNHLNGVRSFTLEAGQSTMALGRASDSRGTVATRNNGLFYSRVVSRKHAQLAVSANGGLTIEDTKSTHGTCMDNEKLVPGSRHDLSQGAIVKLGDTVVEGGNEHEGLSFRIHWLPLSVPSAAMPLHSGLEKRSPLYASSECSSEVPLESEIDEIPVDLDTGFDQEAAGQGEDGNVHSLGNTSAVTKSEPTRDSIRGAFHSAELDSTSDSRAETLHSISAEVDHGQIPATSDATLIIAKKCDIAEVKSQTNESVKRKRDAEVEDFDMAEEFTGEPDRKRLAVGADDDPRPTGNPKAQMSMAQSAARGVGWSFAGIVATFGFLCTPMADRLLA